MKTCPECKSEIEDDKATTCRCGFVFPPSPPNISHPPLTIADSQKEIERLNAEIKKLISSDHVQEPLGPTVLENVKRLGSFFGILTPDSSVGHAKIPRWLVSSIAAMALTSGGANYYQYDKMQTLQNEHLTVGAFTWEGSNVKEPITIQNGIPSQGTFKGTLPKQNCPILPTGTSAATASQSDKGTVTVRPNHAPQNPKSSVPEKFLFAWECPQK